MSFYLRYTNNNWSTFTSLEITSHIRNVENTTNDKISDVTLRGNHYETALYNKRKREINISADFLATDSNYEFLKDFWNAGAKRYSADGTTWTDVIIQDSGDFPVEYIEGHKGLRDVTFTLINRTAD